MNTSENVAEAKRVKLITRCVICGLSLNKDRLKYNAVTCCKAHRVQWQRILVKKRKEKMNAQRGAEEKSKKCKGCGELFNPKTKKATTCPKCCSRIRAEFTSRSPINTKKAHFVKKESEALNSFFQERPQDILDIYPNLKIEYISAIEGETKYEKEIKNFLNKGNKIRRLPADLAIPFLEDLVSETDQDESNYDAIGQYGSKPIQESIF